MSRSIGVSTLAIAAASLVMGSFAAGCSDDERVAPVSDGGGGGTSSAIASNASSSSGSTGGGPVLRTVFERNPFGSQIDNLLADGDFELSFGFAGQQGWTAYNNVGQQSLLAETGGLCHGGLRCARVAAGTLLFARGTAAPDRGDMKATLWAKGTVTQDCLEIMAYVVSCESLAVLPANRLFVAEPDADGWCGFTAQVDGDDTATCLYVENNSTQEFLFDDASLVALPADQAIHPRPRLAPPTVSAATRERMDRLRDHLRDTLPIGKPRRLAPGEKPLPGRSYAEPIDVAP